MTYGLAMSLHRPQAVQCRRSKSAGKGASRIDVTLPRGARATIAARVHTRHVLWPSAFGIESRKANARAAIAASVISPTFRGEAPTQADVNHVGVTVPSVLYRTIRGIDIRTLSGRTARFGYAHESGSHLAKIDAVSFAGRKAPQPLPAIRGRALPEFSARPHLHLNLPGTPAKARGGVSAWEEQSTHPTDKNRSDAATPGTARLRFAYVENQIVRRTLSPDHSREGAR